MKLRLEQFDYDIQYRAGKQNVVADGLSRITNEMNYNDQSDDNQSSSDNDTVHSADSDSGQLIPMTEIPLNYFRNQIILKLGEEDSETYEEIFPKVYRRIITKFHYGIPHAIHIFKNFMHPNRINCIMCPESVINTLQVAYRNYFRRNPQFKIKLTQVSLQDLRTLEEQNQVIEKTHDRAHRGIDENHHVISQQYFFPKMKAKITAYINRCDQCLGNKYERNPYKIKYDLTPIPKKPLDIIHIDIFISNPDLFIAAVDKLSRFATLIPIKSRSIPDVKRGLVKFISTYGTPKLIVCDNEVAFKSIEIRGFLEKLDVEMYFTPSDHSEVNGIVERFHSTLSEIYRCSKQKYNDLSSKELYLISTALYNNTFHSALKLKPIEVFYGVKEGDDRPLNIERIIENRNAIFDEIVYKLERHQKKTIDQRNVSRETEPSLQENEEAYQKIQGIKNKRKLKFRKVCVKNNRRKTFIDQRGIKIHKSKLKRKRKQ